MTDRAKAVATLVAVCVSTATASLSAEEPVRHVVRANETCAAIALRYYGDSRLVDILHRANPILLATPPPHVLREGTVLVIPTKPASPSGPDAQLTTVRNHVDVLTPETKQGKPNDPLFRGNRVSTEEASAADVTFRDETQVKLGERTLVIILGDARAAAARLSETQTTLVTGNLRAFMAGPRKDSASVVTTDAAKVHLFRGEAQVSADAVKTTRLAVYAGSAAIHARDRTQEVARGFGSKAELGKQPTTPRPLPAAPIWSSRPIDVVLDQGKGGAIIGEYDIASTSQRVFEWRVQLARDDVFRDILVDTRVPLTVRRMAVQAPNPGHYFARVSAIDDDRFEGPFGPSARIMVVRMKQTTSGNRRRLEIEPSDAPCMRVGNVPLSWVKGPLDVGLDEPVRLRCAPTATDPTTLLTFD